MQGDLPDTVVIADMEAGLEHLSIGTLAYIDALLVVVQPTMKTMMTAHRTYGLAKELGILEVAFLGNRVTSPADQEQLDAFARDHASELLVSIPDDDSVRRADMHARCLIDVAPDSEMVAGVARLADVLEGRFFPATAPA